MRKLTGYIGAMIIVFALMGSVLMGYALNVNGTNTVVNEYEKVTDVSGLYDHSEEKTYIDYNPATNYIGYKEDVVTYNNLTSPIRPVLFKSITKPTNITARLSTSNPGVIIDGAAQTWPNAYPFYAFACDQFYVYYEAGMYLTFYSLTVKSYVQTTDISITVNLPNITVTFDGTTLTYSNVKMALVQCSNDYDYGCIIAQYDGTKSVYLNNADQTLCTTTSPMGIAVGNSFYSLIDGTTTTQNLVSYNHYTAPNVYDFTVGLDAGLSTWGVFFPASVNDTPGLGIDYTRSNRVNNYPFEYDYNQYTTTQTETVNLMALSAANQFTYNDGWYIGMGLNSADNGQGYYAFAGYFKIKYGVYEYKLSDILSTLTIPAGTTTINIDTGQLNLAVASTIVSVPTSIVSQGYLPVNSSVPYNTELTTIFPNSNQYAGQVTTDYQFNYGIYYPGTGLIDIFDKRNNVKLWTASANDAVIRFVDSSVTVGDYDYNYHGYVNDNYVSGTNDTGFNLGARGTPQLNLTYTINGAITNTYYMDITKGVSIKQYNKGAVTWDNQYENGVIDLLFRAESTTDIYHNDFTVSNNTVSVDFNGGRYSVTLNGGDPIDIGTWRNIVLSIDLINGKLYAIPVKTFNSYTNVVLTNTSVTIGNLVSAQPTNTISWAPTNQSFKFNVYSTRVFMDTYGLIMVNPSLNISDYFTDLNQFYRLDMYNFATYGDSMTINGETLPVNNGLVTYDNKSLELRNFSVTYADGKVSIGDNHTSIEMGNIATTNISMTGAWYFLTDLERGYTTQKVIYDWDWGTFIFDNTQFAVFYLGFMAAALIVARKFCSITITDYAVIVVSIIIALGVQVIA